MIHLVRKGRVGHVLQDVRDTNLFVAVRGQIRGTAFEEPTGRFGNRMVKNDPN